MKYRVHTGDVRLYQVVGQSMNCSRVRQVKKRYILGPCMREEHWLSVQKKQIDKLLNHEGKSTPGHGVDLL